jgi:hypothetical protein
MRAVLTLIALMLAAQPALAGQGLICDGEGVSVHVPLAGIAGIVPLGADISVGGQLWFIGEGGNLLAGQSHGGTEAIRIDFTEAGRPESVAARLRLFSAAEGDADATGGVLHIVGVGAWTLSCSFG